MGALLAATDDPPCASAPVRNLLIFRWGKLSGEKWGEGGRRRGRGGGREEEGESKGGRMKEKGKNMTEKGRRKSPSAHFQMGKKNLSGDARKGEKVGKGKKKKCSSSS